MRIYLESLLEGRVIHPSDPRRTTMVREIEDKEEYDEVPDESRGIITNGRLYMIVNPLSYVIHEHIKDWLYLQKYLKAPYDYERLDKMLMVQKKGDTLYTGESYNYSWLIKHKNEMLKHFRSISYLGIKTSTEKVTHE